MAVQFLSVEQDGNVQPNEYDLKEENWNFTIVLNTIMMVKTRK